MGVLHRKLGRDLRGSLGVLSTVVAIIAVGTGCFIGLGSAQRILETSQRAYYHEYRFADFWVDLKKAPLPAVERIADLPGVAAIEPRVVFDVILDLPGVVQPLTRRLISAPTRGFDRTLNGICLVRGSGFSDAPRSHGEEVILSEPFANAHHLDPGDRIDVILNRKRESLVVVGMAISPEYVYMVRGEGDFVPDPEHFGILYLKQDRARDLLGFRDACNQVVGRLVPGHENDVELLLERIDRRLEPYGVLAKTPRHRQASHRFLSDEITGLGVSAVILPAIFLLVAALVLNVLMARLAERQRSIIGTLKALGYSDRKILIHFLSFGLVVGVVGGLAGNALGVALSSGMIEIYRGFFQFPRFVHRTYPDLLLIGIAISVIFAVAGTTKGVWTVLKLRPAEAMRPNPPQRGGAVFLEKLPTLWRALGFRTHIALRSLARNRTRTLTGVISQGLAISIILLTLVLYDSMWHLVDFQFEEVAHSDVDIGMRDEKSAEVLLEARDLPGVDRAEPTLGMVCDVRKGSASRRLAIIGLAPDHRLTTPRQADLQPIDIPPTGLVMATKLAEILGADVGDALLLTPVRGRRETVRAHLAATVESFVGLDCYADINYLSRLVGEAEAVNSVQLAVDPTAEDRLFRAIKQLPNGQGISVRADTKNNIESTFVETTATSLGLTILFAGVIAFGSVLNASLIEIGDRTRDIATFRVLGYRPAQIAGIFFRQNLAVFCAGLAVALPLGYWMVLVTAKVYDTELFRMPVDFTVRAVTESAAIAFMFVLIAQWFVLRQIQKLDWVEGIKIKE